MSDVSYEAFLPDVIQFVKDVPEIVAVQAIRNAAIQFCEKTRVLQTELTPMDTTQGVSVYPFEPDVGYKVVDIMEAWYGDQLLIPKAVEELTRIYRTTSNCNMPTAPRTRSPPVTGLNTCTAPSSPSCCKPLCNCLTFSGLRMRTERKKSGAK